MKANQKMCKNDIAISPVVGVILMITLILAVAITILAYVNTQTAGKMSYTQNLVDSLKQQLNGDEDGPPDTQEGSQNPGGDEKAGGGESNPSEGSGDPVEMSGGGDWWDESWDYRAPLSFSNENFDEDLSNFPIYVSIEDTSFTKSQKNGNDICFISGDHKTKLDHEIEYFDSNTGKLIAWVKIPQINSETETKIYIYYGNSNCKDQQSPVNVWSNDYILVHHFKESNGEIVDSTTYSNVGTTQGSGVKSIQGKIGNAVKLDSNDNYISITNSDSIRNIDNSLTVEGWFMLDSIKSYIPTPIIEKGERLPADLNYDGIVNAKDFSLIQSHFLNSDNKGQIYESPYPLWDINNDGWTDILDFGVYTGQFGQQSPVWAVYILEEKLIFSSSGLQNEIKSKRSFTEEDIGEWIHFTIIFDGENSYIYINGELDNSIKNAGSIDEILTDLKIGRSNNINYLGTSDQLPYYFNGKLDEIRLSDNPKDQIWISITHINQNNPGIFYTIGEEES